MNNYIKMFVGAPLGMLLSCCQETQASKLLVINNESNPVEVIIQPDNEAGSAGSATPVDGPEIKVVLEKGAQKLIEVSKDALGYPKKISVIGKVTLYSLSQRCSGLDIKKDYEIMLDPIPNGGVFCRFKEVKISD